MVLKLKKGFSLVELLVVIAIIGILAAVGITAYSGYTANAKVKASTSQHSQVVAVVNAEFARCAAGEGTFAWGGNCTSAPVDGSLVGHFAAGTANDLKNPYMENQQSVRVNYDLYSTDTAPATIAIFATAQAVVEDGAMSVFCGVLSTNPDGSDVGGGTGCQVRFNNGSTDHDTPANQEMVTILVY